jgi:signal recognition particle subunit SRP54
VVHDELKALMGGAHEGLDLSTQPPAVVLMAGLQGAGKTTTTGKLAKLLHEQQKKKVLVVSTDVYRPAAIEQLKTVAAQAGVGSSPPRPRRSRSTSRSPRWITRASTISTCCWSTPPAASP